TVRRNRLPPAVYPESDAGCVLCRLPSERCRLIAVRVFRKIHAPDAKVPAGQPDAHDGMNSVHAALPLAPPQFALWPPEAPSAEVSTFLIPRSSSSAYWRWRSSLVPGGT